MHLALPFILKGLGMGTQGKVTYSQDPAVKGPATCTPGARHKGIHVKATHMLRCPAALVLSMCAGHALGVVADVMGRTCVEICGDKCVNTCAAMRGDTRVDMCAHLHQHVCDMWLLAWCLSLAYVHTSNTTSNPFRSGHRRQTQTDCYL